MREESILKEGNTQLIVPRSSLVQKVPPREPAFFNPLGALKRDILVALVAGYASKVGSKIEFGDPLAGVGAGSIRIAKEVKNTRRVYINDLNPKAISFARVSAKFNKIQTKCVFSKSEATSFLSRHSAPHERFDCIELDPFGTPSPFFESAIRACKIGGMISATATDGAVLCGVYPNVCFRKYGGYSLSTDYCHEIAVRILYGSLALAAMRLDVGISPIFAHTTKHYSKVYATINVKPVQTFSEIGHLSHCFSCGFRSIGNSLQACKECGRRTRGAGPLWVGQLFETELIRKSISHAPTKDSKLILEGALREVGSPATYFVIDKICDDLGLPSPALLDLVTILQKKGYTATRTILNQKGIKTDASMNTVMQAIREALPR